EVSKRAGWFCSLVIIPMLPACDLDERLFSLFPNGHDTRHPKNDGRMGKRAGQCWRIPVADIGGPLCKIGERLAATVAVRANVGEHAGHYAEIGNANGRSMKLAHGRERRDFYFALVETRGHQRNNENAERDQHTTPTPAQRRRQQNESKECKKWAGRALG